MLVAQTKLAVLMRDNHPARTGGGDTHDGQSVVAVPPRVAQNWMT